MITKEQIEEQAHHYAQVQYGDPAKMDLREIIKYDNGVEDFEAGALWMQDQQGSGIEEFASRQKDMSTEMLEALNKASYKSLSPTPIKLDESTPSEIDRLREEKREMLEMLHAIRSEYHIPDLESLITKIESNGN